MTGNSTTFQSCKIVKFKCLTIWKYTWNVCCAVATKAHWIDLWISNPLGWHGVFNAFRALQGLLVSSFSPEGAPYTGLCIYTLDGIKWKEQTTFFLYHIILYCIYIYIIYRIVVLPRDSDRLKVIFSKPKCSKRTKYIKIPTQNKKSK